MGAQNRPLQLFILVFTIVLFSQLIQWEGGFDANTLLIITTIFYAIIFFSVFMFLRLDGESFSNLGLRVSGLGIVILLAAALGFIAQLIWAVLISAASGNLVFDFGALPFGTFLAQVIVMALITGLVEEIAFRGYMQRKFMSSYGTIRALIFASFLFMIVHLQFYTFYKLFDPNVMATLGLTEGQVWMYIQFAITQTVIAISALGFFTGYLYFKTKQNVLPPALFHITFNVGGLIMLSYSNSSVAAFSLNYGLFAGLWVIWACIVAVLIWITTKILPTNQMR